MLCVYWGRMKHCPLCQGDCPIEAKVCLHCRHYFTPAENGAAIHRHRVRRFAQVAAIVFFVIFTIDMLGGVETLGAMFGSISAD